MSREFADLADLSEGMNQEAAITAETAQPWFIQDGLLTREPWLERRGPYSKRAPQANFGGKVLAMGIHAYGARKRCVLVVQTGGGWTRIYALRDNEQRILLHAVEDTASYADITGGWVAGTEDKPTSTVITTDIGTWELRYDDQDSPPEEITVIARRNASSGTQLNMGGFCFTATAGPYTFLANSRGDNNSKSRHQTLWWSKIMNSGTWESHPDAANLQNGGRRDIPGSDTSHITGLAELSGSLIIFKRQALFKMTVSADPNDWQLRQVGGVGTIDHRSIAEYDGSLLFADANGVYLFSGYDISEVSRPIRPYYEQLTRNFTEAWSFAGFVYGDYYLLSIHNGNMVHQGTLILHVPTGKWGTISNLPFVAASPADRLDRRAFAVLSSGETIRLDQIFDPTRNGRDAVGDGPHFKLETRRLLPGGLHQRHIWRSLRTSFECRGGGALDVSYVKGIDPGATPTKLATYTAQAGMREEVERINASAPAIGVVVEESAPANNIRLAGLEVGFRPQRRGRS